MDAIIFLSEKCHSEITCIATDSNIPIIKQSKKMSLKLQFSPNSYLRFGHVINLSKSIERLIFIRIMYNDLCILIFSMYIKEMVKLVFLHIAIQWIIQKGGQQRKLTTSERKWEIKRISKINFILLDSLMQI